MSHNPSGNTGLDPQIAGMIEQLDSGFPAVHTMTGAQARAAIAGRLVLPADPEPVAEVQDRLVPGPSGVIPVRIYRPAGDPDLPILVYAHGGGFVFCNLDSHDGLCRSLSNLIGTIVISVDYRLAPEHPWPAAAEDVYAVTRWAFTQAAEFGGDPQRLLVGGDSAGGNLAAVTTLMARDRHDPPLTGQLLLYPVIAPDFDTDSYREFGSGYYNPTPALQWYWDQYVPTAADRRQPYACPLGADLHGLPPAVIALAGHDPLRDEGLAYSCALQEAGVPTTEYFYAGGIHGFMTMPMLDLAQRARIEVSHAVAQLISAPPTD